MASSMVSGVRVSRSSTARARSNQLAAPPGPNGRRREHPPGEDTRGPYPRAPRLRHGAPGGRHARPTRRRRPSRAHARSPREGYAGGYVQETPYATSCVSECRNEYSSCGKRLASCRNSAAQRWASPRRKVSSGASTMRRSRRYGNILAEDRRALEQVLLFEGQAVDPAGEHGLDGRRHLDPLNRSGRAGSHREHPQGTCLDKCADALLEEEGDWRLVRSIRSCLSASRLGDTPSINVTSSSAVRRGSGSIRS